MFLMTMTTTSSSSAETINTKQLSRIGSSSSSSHCGCSTSRTTTTAGSSGGTPTPSSGCSTSRSNKSVTLIPNTDHHSHHHHHHHHHQNNGHHSHHHHHHQNNGHHSGQHHHHARKAMTERWFLCSSTARTEARLLALLDLISSIAYLIVFGLLTYAIFEHPELVRRYLDEVPENQDIARLLTYGTTKKAFFLSILMLRPAASLFIAILLFVGAQKRSYGIVRMCFIISIVYIVVDVILFIPKTIYTQNGKIYVITYLFNVVYMLYELWVNYELKKEVQEWHEKQGSDGEPETEDTTVVGEGDSAAGDE